LTTVGTLLAAALIVDVFSGGEALFGGKQGGGGNTGS